MVSKIEKIKNRDDFLTILNENKGIIIIKFGAEWCSPCGVISPYIEQYVSSLSDTFTLYDLDIDDNFEIYAYLKSKKMVTGIPTLLAYYKGNFTFASNECVSGINETHYKTFFERCLIESHTYN
tara:strand:+ start:3330 stop:3701 length:372 start_codon:yes stop_codon:yes gene_type:complete